MSRRGVTLIELVVGLTVGAALLGAGYAALGTALDRRELAIQLVDVDLDGVATRAALRAWLEGARTLGETTAPLFRGEDGVWGDVPDDQLTFLTAAPTPTGRGLTTVRLFIDRDPETIEEGLVADFGVWLGTDRYRLVLVREATGLDVRYRSSVLSGRVWHPSWISSSVMPLGIEVLVEGSTELHPMLQIPVRVAFAGGR